MTTSRSSCPSSLRGATAPVRVPLLFALLLLSCLQILPHAHAQVIAVPPPPPGSPPPAGAPQGPPPAGYATILPQKDTLTMANPKFILALYPLAFVGGHFMIGGEYGLSQRFGLRLNASVGVAENSNYYSNYDDNVRDMTAYYGELQARYYPLGKGVQGLFVSPYLYYKGMNFTNVSYDPVFGFGTTTPASAQAFGVGAVVGYNLLFLRNTISVDMYVGGGPQLPGGDYALIDNNVIDSYSRSMVLQAGFNIGVRLK